MGLFLLSQQAPDLTSSLSQYGALGVVAAICMYAVYKIFNRLVDTHKAELERIAVAHTAAIQQADTAHHAAIQRADAAYDREVARGDRLEGELRDLNKLVNDKLAGELVRATDAIREAFETMHEQRRRQ